MEIRSGAKADFDIHENLTGEIGVFVVEGYIEACGQRIDQRNMLVSKQENACKLVIGENTTLFGAGGEPFQTPDSLIGILFLPQKKK